MKVKLNMIEVIEIEKYSLMRKGLGVRGRVELGNSLK